MDAVERKLLELIVQHLQDNKMDVPTAQKLARDFLSVLPVQSRADLLNKLKNLGEKYDEAKQVYFQESSKDNEAKEKEALYNMTHAIRQGNIDHALSIAKNLKEATN